MNHAYQQGRDARMSGWTVRACPHGHQTHRSDKDTSLQREQSPLCLRHWWLAGWHDADIELGCSVLEDAA